MKQQWSPRLQKSSAPSSAMSSKDQQIRSIFFWVQQQARGTGPKNRKIRGTPACNTKSTWVRRVATESQRPPFPPTNTRVLPLSQELQPGYFPTPLGWLRRFMTRLVSGTFMYIPTGAAVFLVWRPNPSGVQKHTLLFRTHKLQHMTSEQHTTSRVGVVWVHTAGRFFFAHVKTGELNRPKNIYPRVFECGSSFHQREAGGRIRHSSLWNKP